MKMALSTSPLYFVFVFCIVSLTHNVCAESHRENYEDSEEKGLPNDTHLFNAISELGKLINKEFRKMKNKFDELDSKIVFLNDKHLQSTNLLTDVIRKIDGIENKVNEIDTKMESFNGKSTVMNENMESLNEKSITMNEKLDSLSKQSSEMKNAVESIQEKYTLLHKKQNNATAVLLSRIGNITIKLVGEVNTKMVSINGISRQLTEKFESLMLKTEELNSTAAVTKRMIEEIGNNSNESINDLNTKLESISTTMTLLSEQHLNGTSILSGNSGKIESIKKSLIQLNRRVESVADETSNLSDNNGRITSLLQDAIEKIENSESSFERTDRKIELLDQKTERLNSQTSNSTIEVRRVIEKMEGFERMFKKLDDVTMDIKQLTGGHSNSSPHRIDSSLKQLENSFLLESEMMHGINKLNNCGGSAVADNGILRLGVFKNEIGARKCIWTVRANKRSKVTFYMETKPEIGWSNSYITLTPYQLFNNASNSSTGITKILLSDTKHYEVDGPLVFVTLHWEPENDDDSEFKLHFFGSSSNVNEDFKYSHYHFTQNSGQVKYPFYGEKYQYNELVTFVINPLIYTNFSITLQHLNIEMSNRCQYDSLIVLHDYWPNKSNTSSVGDFRAFGPKESDYRYCGILNETTQVIQPQDNTSAYIIIFKSDKTFNFDGFQFSWNV